MQIGLSLQSLVAELYSLLVVADLHRVYVELEIWTREKQLAVSHLCSFPEKKAAMHVLC